MTAKLDDATLDIERRALEIFEAVLAFAEAEWASRTTALCADDCRLERRVNALLARAARDSPLLMTGGLAPWLAEDCDALPERVGAYRVTGLLGRGGMGVVVRGERDDGVFDQQVAIKLMRGNLVTADALDRFLAERRILGRLVAPGIARILDGGSMAGIPWLAMDLVDGTSITDYATAAALGVAARLSLFRQACESVAFAHRALVIHADIKPSNIMVDAEGTVKLLDFGIARLIGDDSIDAPALTRTYAAPELLAGARASVASDVFSLGRILADLFVGLPVDADLSAIMARAMASDAAQRYPDVPALLADLDARDQHRTVTARATPLGARLGKFFRRQRIATGVGLVLIAATAVSTVQYGRAERARAEAEQRFFEVRDLASFMLFTHYDRLADMPGTAAARAELAATAGRYLDQLAGMKEAPDDLRLDTARGFRRLATVLGAAGDSNLGRTEDAKAALTKAETMLASLGTDNAAVHEERGWVMAVRWTTLADSAESSQVNQTAARHFAAALAQEPARPGARLGALTTAKNQAYMLLWDDRAVEATVQFKTALNQLRRTRWPVDHAAQARALEYVLLSQIGDGTYYSGDQAGSLPWYQEAAALVDTELARNPTQLWHDRFGDAQYNLSGTLMDLPGQRRSALAAAQRGRAAMEARLAMGFDETIEKRLTSLLGQESLVLEDLGQADAALARQRQYVAIREARHARNPEGQQANRDMGIAYTLAAEQLQRLGRSAGACQAGRQANKIWERMATMGWLTAMDAKRQRGKVDAVINTACKSAG